MLQITGIPSFAVVGLPCANGRGEGEPGGDIHRCGNLRMKIYPMYFESVVDAGARIKVLLKKGIAGILVDLKPAVADRSFLCFVSHLRQKCEGVVYILLGAVAVPGEDIQ